MQPAHAFRNAAELLADGDAVAAKRALESAFPAPGVSTTRRAWTKTRLLRVFIRDGFTDRYDGKLLVFPGALRAMSVLAPDLVPYHSNWKQDSTHPAYWSLYSTIDHVIPVARQGADDESNAVTTSMLHNAAKANWLLSELGWSEPLPTVGSDWDGLLPWFCTEYDKRPELKAIPVLQAWRSAVKSAGF